MARRVKVFFVVLFSACLFSVSAFADFGISDSSNLGLIESWCESISNNLISYFDPSRYTSFSYQALSKLDSIISSFSTSNSSLSSIYSLLQNIASELGASDANFDDSQVYLSFDNRTAYYDGTKNENYPYMINFQGTGVLRAGNTRPLVYTAEPGKYILLLNINYGYGITGVAFGSDAVEGATNSRFPDSGFLTPTLISTSSGVTKYRLEFTLEDYLSFTTVTIQTNGGSVWLSAYLYRIDGEESVAGDLVNSDITDSTTQVSDGVNQLEGLEDQVFGSLDTSIGSIDFSGSALGQVVSGFTFIRAVFSAIYSSSPYISVLINLSCMFGVLALFLRVQPRFSRWEREHRDRSD